MLKLVAVVVAILIAACGLLGRLVDKTNHWFWVWNGLALLLVGVQGFIGVKALRSARAAQEEFKLVVYDQLGPLARELTLFARLGVAGRRERMPRTLLAGVGCAAGLANTSRVRATIYRRTKTPEGHESFEPHTTTGRGDQPQSNFVRGINSVEGEAVWERAERDLPRYCKNVKRDPPPGWDKAKKRRYKTFITVPVRAGDDLVGLLTVNAPKPGDLTENDVGSMQVMAGLLGAALGMAGVQWPVRGT